MFAAIERAWMLIGDEGLLQISIIAPPSSLRKRKISVEYRVAKLCGWVRHHLSLGYF
jgi:hypothetical protein